ncbi:MAG: YicC/YloC family endoribonuclease [Pseudomonadota bacterium]
MDGHDMPPALMSMTGFAARTGTFGAYSWSAELRSVNGKGRDLRLRVPDWVEGLEPAVRSAITARVSRGALNLSIRVTREDSAGLPAVAAPHLAAMLTALAEIEAQAMEAGLSLAPSTATQIAGLRGVIDTAQTEEDTAALRTALLTDLEPLLDAFEEMRSAEGAALAQVLGGQLDAVAEALGRAEAAAAARAGTMEAALRRNLAKVLDAADTDPQRVAQELALIAVKADVTEEIDRLNAHIGAARDLLNAGGPVGRKLDFLMQEFIREANTLCSKAQDTDLTQAGLDLKVLIDQMREQVQNVE